MLTPQATYDLGRDWYATRLDLDWTRPSAETVTHMFAQRGLSGPFWSLATEVG